MKGHTAIVLFCKRNAAKIPLFRIVLSLIAILAFFSVSYVLIRGVPPREIQRILVERRPGHLQILRHKNEFAFFVECSLSIENVNRRSGGRFLSVATELHVIFSKKGKPPEYFFAGHFSDDNVSPTFHPNFADVIRIRGNYFVLHYANDSGSWHQWRSGTFCILGDSEISNLFSYLGKKRIPFTHFNQSAFLSLMDKGWEGNMHPDVHGLARSQGITINWPDGLRQDLHRRSVDGIDTIFLSTNMKDEATTEIPLMPYGESQIEVPASLLKKVPAWLLKR